MKTDWVRNATMQLCKRSMQTDRTAVRHYKSQVKSKRTVHAYLFRLRCCLPWRRLCPFTPKLGLEANWFIGRCWILYTNPYSNPGIVPITPILTGLHLTSLGLFSWRWDAKGDSLSDQVEFWFVQKWEFWPHITDENWLSAKYDQLHWTLLIDQTIYFHQ